MPLIDMPIEQLRQYNKPSQYREPDFEDFWDSTVTTPGVSRSMRS